MLTEFGKQFAKPLNVTLVNIEGEHPIEKTFAAPIPYFPAPQDDLPPDHKAVVAFKKPL